MNVKGTLCYLLSYRGKGKFKGECSTVESLLFQNVNTICENLGSWHIVWGHFVAMNLDYGCMWSMQPEYKTDEG